MTDGSSMDLMEALYTTRSMRRVATTPIDIDIQAAIIDAAIRAPNGGNRQDWKFLFIDDRATMAWLGEQYRAALWPTMTSTYGDTLLGHEDPNSVKALAAKRILSSVRWLGDNFADVPLLLFAFTRNDQTGGSSIYPSLWSAQLVARSFDIGSTLTVLFRKPDLAELIMQRLEVPDEGWALKGGVTFGYPLGRWGVAPREPAHEVTFRNKWGQAPGFEVRVPLWAPR
jgi:nitroreductase